MLEIMLETIEDNEYKKIEITANNTTEIHSITNKTTEIDLHKTVTKCKMEMLVHCHNTN